MWRDHLAAAGKTIDDVQAVVLPFPEQETALEQGNINATCAVNPFYSSMSGYAALVPVTITSGRLHDLSTPLMNVPSFASGDWLATNGETVVKAARGWTRHTSCSATVRLWNLLR